MKTLLTILFLIFWTFESYSHNDTIQLFDNHILIGGHEYNRVINGAKQGPWIDFTINNDEFSISNASGYDRNGNNVHWYTMTQMEFRPLRTMEKEGEIQVLTEKVDTTFGDRRYDISALSIHSRVPPDKYYVTAKGNYRNDLKTGKWTFYHNSGSVRKEIEYSNGLPTSGYKIFRENGDLMIDVIRLNNTDWNICRYSEKGKLLDCELKKIDEFRPLY
jgi:hypothetical protein